jgi:hypothetical protein
MFKATLTVIKLIASTFMTFDKAGEQKLSAETLVRLDKAS